MNIPALGDRLKNGPRLTSLEVIDLLINDLSDVDLWLMEGQITENKSKLLKRRLILTFARITGRKNRLVHKGEKVIPKNKVNAQRKKG